MKIFPLTMILFALTVSLLLAQRPQPDTLPTESGPISIQPVLHGTLVLSWNDLTIYVDPYGGGKAFAGIKKPDLVLITDVHGDHLNTETLNALDLTAATLVVPEAVAAELSAVDKSAIVVLKNQASTTRKGVKISALPMYNLPEAPDSRHPKGRGNGYVLEMGNKRIYISGDTEDIPEMRDLRNIDVAFVCMNLPYTMDITQAADAVGAFKPAVVYPYHYRGQGGLSDTEAFGRLVKASSPEVEVRLRNWYPEY